MVFFFFFRFSTTSAVLCESSSINSGHNNTIHYQSIGEAFYRQHYRHFLWEPCEHDSDFLTGRCFFVVALPWIHCATKTNTKTMANTLRESNAILETYNLRGLFSLMKTCDLTNKTPMTQTNTKTKISKSNHR